MKNREVLQMISAMRNKSCELDAVPTALLKKILPRCRPNNAASQHLTHYGRILLRIEDSSGKTIIEKAWPITSMQELQNGIQPLLPLKASQKMYAEAANATL